MADAGTSPVDLTSVKDMAGVKVILEQFQKSLIAKDAAIAAAQAEAEAAKKEAARATALAADNATVLVKHSHKLDHKLSAPLSLPSNPHLVNMYAQHKVLEDYTYPCICNIVDLLEGMPPDDPGVSAALEEAMILKRVVEVEHAAIEVAADEHTRDLPAPFIQTAYFSEMQEQLRKPSGMWDPQGSSAEKQLFSKPEPKTKKRALEKAATLYRRSKDGQGSQARGGSQGGGAGPSFSPAKKPKRFPPYNTAHNPAHEASHRPQGQGQGGNPHLYTRK